VAAATSPPRTEVKADHPIATAPGNQTSADTNGRFILAFQRPVDDITLPSRGNSFEVASIAAAVPEPAD